MCILLFIRAMFKQRFLYILGISLLGVSLIFVKAQILFAAGEYSAKWVAQDEEVSMKTGETRSIWVEIKNTGTTTWANQGINAVKIATVRKRDRSSAIYSSSWLSNNRLTTAEQDEIAPGEIGHFVFEVTAGIGEGTHREYFGLVTERVAWFDDFEFYIDIEVLPAIFSGEVISQVQPIKLKAGETQQLSVQVKNTGDVTWDHTDAYAVKVGTIGDKSSALHMSSWLSRNRIVSPNDDIAPGEIAIFDFSVAAPSKVGVYKERFGIVVERLAWLEDTTFELNITVEPAIYSASFMRQSENPILTPEEETTLWVELRNEGNTTWKSSGERTTKLGTARSLDRESVFYNKSWLGTNRTTAVDKDVQPGEIGKFIFTIKAPEKISTYTEYVRPVVEHVTWMEDLDIHWEIMVNEELVLDNPIRVGLNPTTEAVTINSSNGFVIRKGSNKDLVARIPSNQPVVISLINNGYSIKVGGENHDVLNYLRCVPLKDSILSVSNEQVSSYYDQFRGVIGIRRSSLSGRAWIVNELELEDYLKGIAEVPSNWPLEARKAQVVAARTFALRRMDTPKADIFDIYDDTRDQVYYGYNYEIDKPGILQAVEATTGIAVVYNGQPALTYYHSDSGGGTDNVWDVWSGSQTIPYLRAVDDPYAKLTAWSATLNQRYVHDRFDEQLNKAGASSATVIDMIIDERYASGRVKKITLVTSNGKRATMDMPTFDYLTDNTHVKSMNFTVKKTGASNSPDFILEGQGNGHGIGMSQWSAYNMANLGQTYDQILKFFYSGVTVGLV